MSGGGSGGIPIPTLHTTEGSVMLTPAAIKAHGQQRMRIEGTRIVGAAILLLIAAFGLSLWKGSPNQDLLTCIGTLVGTYLGHVFSRSST